MHLSHVITSLITLAFSRKLCFLSLPFQKFILNSNDLKVIVCHICGACAANKTVIERLTERPSVTARTISVISPSPCSREWKEVSDELTQDRGHKLRPYLHTVRAVAFTENHHWVGVDELLYLGFEIILPGLVFDGRHFEDNSTCLQKASVERWTIRRNPRPLKPQ